MYIHYAHIENGVVVEYPVNPRVRDHATNTFNIHEYWEGGELNGKVYVFCHNTPPVFRYDEALIEKKPAFNAETGLWHRQYDLVKVSPETLSKRREMAQNNINELLDILFIDLAKMAQIISELSDVEKNKWQEYRSALLNIPAQMDYPFYYNIPIRPDEMQDLKIGVTRI